MSSIPRALGPYITLINSDSLDIQQYKKTASQPFTLISSGS